MPDSFTLSTRQHYRRMTVQSLLALRDAFTGDAEEAALRGSLTTRRFCEERIALIGEVLKEKAGLRQARARATRARQEPPEEGE